MGAAILACTSANSQARAADTAQSPEPSYIYATVGFDKIKPELVLEEANGSVTGIYTATQSESELDAIYRTGTYGITSGTLEGQFSGNTLSGYWYETAYNAGLQSSCDTERNGTRVFGRFVLTFSKDRKSFTGLRTGCEIVPDAYEHAYNTWNGKLTGRGAVASNTSISAKPASAKPVQQSKPVVSAATPPVGAGQAGEAKANVYATVGFDKIKPELVLEEANGSVTGIYTATQSESELDAIYRTGTYGITSGTLEGQFSGNTLSGYWYETAYNAGLQSSCDTERNGTRVFGRFVLTFSKDRKSFTGLRTGCEIIPDAYEHSYNTWNGTLIRQQAVAASPAPGRTKAKPGTASTAKASRKTARKAGKKPGGRIVDSAARGAEYEIDAKAEEAARKVTRGVLDRVF